MGFAIDPVSRLRCTRVSRVLRPVEHGCDAGHGDRVPQVGDRS
ncbi:hypothetical protein Ae263Ps1_3772 [Pseudonocardia sp. Ae263_Ps1]|nr:hypothetical protein Ae263Ps1_3772 [Pseudonocardia sp. Ae263_Ps1]